MQQHLVRLVALDKPYVIFDRCVKDNRANIINTQKLLRELGFELPDFEHFLLHYYDGRWTSSNVLSVTGYHTIIASERVCIGLNEQGILQLQTIEDKLKERATVYLTDEFPGNKHIIVPNYFTDTITLILTGLGSLVERL